MNEMATRLLSPTGANASLTEEREAKEVLTLYWPTVITTAKPRILSACTPDNGNLNGEGTKKGSKWLLGWNPRGLVVVIGAVVEVPTLSACQSVLEELHRDPPLNCDPSVMKYLHILGRLDYHAEYNYGKGSRSVLDEEDEIQTNKLKNTEDIWVELYSTDGASAVKKFGDNSKKSKKGVNFSKKGSETSSNKKNTSTSPVVIHDLHCCGYRQAVNLVTIRYDPAVQYPTGTCGTTPLATPAGALMSQAITNGQIAKLSRLALAPGAKSRLEGTFIDPVVQQLCAPPPAPEVVSPDQKSSPLDERKSSLTAQLNAHAHAAAAAFDKDNKRPNKDIVVSNSSLAGVAGSQAGVLPTNNSFQMFLRNNQIQQEIEAKATARSPQLQKHASNDQISAMAAEMLHQSNNSMNHIPNVHATSSSAGLNSSSTPTPHGTPKKRPHPSHQRFTSSNSIGNATPLKFQLGSSAMAQSGTTSIGGGFFSQYHATDNNSVSNDSFCSSHSFAGQVASGPASDTIVNTQAAPRLKYDNHESFTEFSVILKCCNHSAKITECLFDIEETMAEADPQADDTPIKTTLVDDSTSTPNPSIAGHTSDLPYDDVSKEGSPLDDVNTPNGRGPQIRTTVENSSLISPQSSMKRRRNADGGGVTSPLASVESPNSSKNLSNSSLMGKNKAAQISLAKVKSLANSIEQLVVPFILKIVIPLLSVIRDYSYVARHLEYRSMEIVNALSIVAGKSTSCGQHPVVPHSLEGTSGPQRFWCVARCFLQIALDVLLGWAFGYSLMFFEESFLSYVRPFAWYGLYDMHLSYLAWFEGWPGGFKMNDDLNTFIAFFTRLSLNIWRNVVSFNDDWDWLGFAMLGFRVCCFFGLSVALNFVSDCCNVATLHLRNAFHMLRVVYVRFGLCLRSLALQFRGKRVNPLRNRVDNFEFNEDQTVIGMLLVTVVAFLFPTLALHYYYLAVVRTSVWFVQEYLCALAFAITNFPIASIAFWAFHRKEIVQTLTITGITINGATGSVEMSLAAQHMPLSESLVDWITLMKIVFSPLQPQKLFAFIVSASLKPAINARQSVYPHLCENCVSPSLGNIDSAGQTSRSS